MIDYKVIAVVGFIVVVTGGVTISSFLLSTRPTKNEALSATPITNNTQVLGTKSTPEIEADKLYGLINGYRREQGKTVLKAHKSLEMSAQFKLSDMIAKKYWRHENADNQEPWPFFTQAGYAYSRAGENLAFGTTSAWATLQKWQESPSHNAQLLEEAYRDMGLAIDCNSYENYADNTCVVVLHLATSR
ncbi:MAG: hypothetical protein COY80_00415 [Candidatus Pacebacteria bacterium CG_4_10_14_0_8_um_filter_42_14]|nr:MAG: hypothetical protein COY80_00415 [Candidatus Pacebacteria bacterium CG_4_10_14_0_8_um_filter_42_14]